MKDRIPLYPGRVKLNPVSGQANTFDLVRADQPQQEGTPLNKASLLKNTTAALFGLGADALPDDVLAEIGKYKQYWWKRKKVTYVEKQEKSDEAIFGGKTTPIITYADSISIDKTTGEISLVNPQTVTLSSSSEANTLLGKYCKTVDITPEKILKYPDSNVNWEFNTGWPRYIKGTPVYIITSEANIASTAEYVRSSDRNAYPDSGMQDVYKYEYLGIPFENAVTALKVETGSYVGTGTYGSSNPNSLTFGFEPKLVFISGNNKPAYHGGLFMCFDLTDDYAVTNGYGYQYFGETYQSNNYAKKAGNTLFWYHTESYGKQLNNPNYTYNYIAIG